MPQLKFSINNFHIWSTVSTIHVQASGPRGKTTTTKDYTILTTIEAFPKLSFTVEQPHCV